MRFVYVTFLLLAGRLLPAQGPVISLGDRSLSGESRTWRRVDPAVEVCTDPGGTLNWVQIAALPDSMFRPADAPGAHGRARQGVEWRRFRFANRFSAESSFYLEGVNPFIPQLSFFQLDSRDRLIRAVHTGALLPFETRDIEHRNFIFEATIAPGDTATFYLALRPVQAFDLRILLWTQDERRNVQQRVEDILLTVFFVFTALYLLLSGMLISVTRQYDQWFYFTYVLLTAFFIALHSGLGSRYLWPNAPELQFVLPAALNNLRLVFGIEFFRRYYELSRRSPTLNRFINGTLLFFLATALLQSMQHWLDAALVNAVQWAFFVFLIGFSVVMLGWTLRQIVRRRWQRGSWLFFVIALHFIGLASTSLQYLGYQLRDPLAVLLPWGLGDRTATFFLQPFVMSAFFLEMMLVFYFSTRRYLRLYDKEQRAMVKLARAREEGIQALLLGAENERRRIARDLHDGACVSLAAIRMKLDALGEPASDPRLTSELNVIGNELEETYRELRGLSHDLMSQTLEKTDLRTAIEELVARMQRARPTLQVDLYINYSLNQMAGLAKIHLYRILQELLGNILKHAEARRITLQLLDHDGRLLLTVEDDGRGFEPGQNDGPGIGLRNVAARVQLLHGTLHLDARPGKGTFVSIEV